MFNYYRHMFNHTKHDKPSTSAINNIDNGQSMPYNVLIICEGIILSNLLLITDVAHLRNIFARLTNDKTIRLRIANSLEKGGEEIAVEKPDVVFVQTHLSGFSSDILIMHLKKQLGRKRSRFVLLAAPSQVNETILAPYKGWLDTTSEDEMFFADLQNLLASLAPRTKKRETSIATETSAVVMPDLPIATALTTTDSQTTVDSLSSQPPPLETITVPIVETASEPSSEEQGITYSPRPRFTVHSEFNSSFDNAVSSAPAPKFITEAAPALKQDRNTDNLDLSDFSSPRSKSSAFILWLAPVIIAVVVATFLQQRNSPPMLEPTVTTPPATMTQAQKSSRQTMPGEQIKHSPVTEKPNPQAPVAVPDHGINDKTVMSAIAENGAKNNPAVSTANSTHLTRLPDFIPRYGFDKHFSAANPGWERYKGQVTEFKVYRESQAIKAIQVIDRGGQGVPESFMKGVMRQIVKKPVFTIETTEKNDGYEIQRGRLAENLKVVYYRDAKSGKLRAFVLTWK